METIECELKVGEEFFAEVRNKTAGEVVMVIRRPGGRVLLISKPFYPEGIFRLPSGTMQESETPEEALVREAKEETGFTVQMECFIGTINWTFKHGHKIAKSTSYILITPEIGGEPQCMDIEEEISEYQEIGPCDLLEIARRLNSLRGKWRDWGRFRAAAHELAWRSLCSEPSTGTNERTESC